MFWKSFKIANLIYIKRNPHTGLTPGIKCSRLLENVKIGGNILVWTEEDFSGREHTELVDKTFNNSNNNNNI